MKYSRAHKSYPTWRQRDTRTLLFSLTVGVIAAAILVGVIYLMNRMH